MKKLVLGSLLLAALASQTTGCIITTDDDPDFARIDADWSFHTVNPTGQLSPENNCPAGFPTAALHTVELDANDRPISGTQVVDLFDCDRGADFSDPLPPGVYEAFISITSDSGLNVYADSLPEILDVRTSNKTHVAPIVDNGGYFKFAWDLRDQANAPLTCRNIPELDGIEIASTIAGTTMAVTDIFDCERGFDFSAALIADDYVVSVSAINGNNPPEALGVADPITTKILDRNEVTDLGTVIIPID